ncbi:MAG: argininosuccinate lyase [Bacteroidales bacterium]
MKLWDKGKDTDAFVEQYTTSADKQMDMYLAEHDVIGTLAHITMLQSVGFITSTELADLKTELRKIYFKIKINNFQLDDDSEDIHSQVEKELTQTLGDVGKKVHTGRSRNDQVLVDIRLFTRDKLIDIAYSVANLFSTLINLSEKHKNTLMPGYTHLQVAMPSSFGLWFGAYAEALSDDLILLRSAYQINNQNPLGSAAGYGSSFPLDRELTTELLGFERMNVNSVYAQMGRGKVERIVAFAIANLASTIGKMSADVCLFMSQNFDFVKLPDSLTTGSSIMPHKKNPDLFEITRGKCNKLQSLPTEIGQISSNLTTGYFRDYQLIKESYLPAFDEITNILDAIKLGVDNLIVREKILENPIYNPIFTVERINELVVAGVPFRDAYKTVGNEVENNLFDRKSELKHTHVGSIGNLGNNKIVEKFNSTYQSFNPHFVQQQKNQLLNDSKE